MHDESARREWKRGDRYLDTSARLFEIANRIASFDERPNLRSPSPGGIHKERVTPQPDFLVPPVPRSFAQKRGAGSFVVRHCLSRRIWPCHYTVGIQQPKPRTIAMSAGRTRSAMRQRLTHSRAAVSVRADQDQLAQTSASARLEDFRGAVGRAVVDQHH